MTARRQKAGKAREIDPITFAVLSNKLWAINMEGAIALRQVSGSPVATEANDMNTTILTPTGEVILAGAYILSGAVAQGLILPKILSEYADNPGISPDDMFLCNDPYSGSLHQNCVTVMGPIHWKARVVMWAGATLHVADVGGSTAGQVNPDARSIYEEAPLIPPIRIVEGGRLRHDLEEEYLIRSRTRDLNALDLRAKIAAVNVVKRRVLELIERYGLEVVEAATENIISDSESRLRARLSEMPDGRWEHVSYLDHHDRKGLQIYPIRVSLTKEGDRLSFDFAGTALQAPAIINCTYAGLLSGVVIAALAYLCFDIPWSPAAVARVVTISAESGTLVNASWPAGVSKATTAAGAEVTTAASACLAKMLAASGSFRDHAMSPWGAGAPLVDMFGVDQHGFQFGAVLVEGLARGAGAGQARDGMDAGGSIRSTAGAVANVETLEFRYPLLFLSRRQQQDSGGAGRQRGGVGITTVITPHRVDRIPQVTMHTNCAVQPGGVGVEGGFPGSTNQIWMLRGSDVWDQMAQGRVPVDTRELTGEMEAAGGFMGTSLDRGDVLEIMVSGGGGFGDPLDREPTLVARDVANGLVSRAEASRIYGVEVDAATGLLDPVLTQRTTEERRASRGSRTRSASAGDGRNASLTPALCSTGLPGGEHVRCRCGHEFPGGSESFKAHALCQETPLQAIGPWVNPARIEADRFVLRTFSCPNCRTLLATDVQQPAEPLLRDSLTACSTEIES